MKVSGCLFTYFPDQLCDEIVHGASDSYMDQQNEDFLSLSRRGIVYGEEKKYNVNPMSHQSPTTRRNKHYKKIFQNRVKKRILLN